jgi:hypothetical protein
MIINSLKKVKGSESSEVLSIETKSGPSYKFKSPGVLLKNLNVNLPTWITVTFVSSQKGAEVVVVVVVGSGPIVVDVVVEEEVDVVDVEVDVVLVLVLVVVGRMVVVVVVVKPGLTKLTRVKVVDPDPFEAVSLTVKEPPVAYKTIGFCAVLPVGDAVLPNSQYHPVGANCQGDLTLVSLKETVAPMIGKISVVAPVLVAKFVYGGVGTGPCLVVTPSGVVSKLGDPNGTLSSLPGVLCIKIGISAYLIWKGRLSSLMYDG